MQKALKRELTDQKVARFLSDLNRLMFKHRLLLNGNAGVNIRQISKEFKGYMAQKWSHGEGYDLREINLKLLYPVPPGG